MNQTGLRRAHVAYTIVYTTFIAGLVAAPPVLDLGNYRPVQERADGQNADLAVAAAISGGGHRAANFAIGVMLALENFEIEGTGYDLLREIDYFSTVCGGGFAAGAYIASLHAAAADSMGHIYPLLLSGVATPGNVEQVHQRLFGFYPIHAGSGRWNWNGHSLSSSAYGSARRESSPPYDKDDPA